MGRLSYVYLVSRPNGVPLYIGKGTGERWLRHRARAAANPHYARILERAGGSLPVSIIARGLSEREAFRLEELLTRSIGIESEGGPLVNCGHGGHGGPSGIKRSKEWRKNRRLKAIEAWRDESYRAKMLRADRKRSGNNHPRSASFKASVSHKLKGNTHTLGFKHSADSRAKMKSRWGDPVWRSKEMARRWASGMYSYESCSRRWENRTTNAKGCADKKIML